MRTLWVRSVPIVVLLLAIVALAAPGAAQQPRIGITVSAWFIPPANDLFKEMVAEWAKQKGVVAEVEFVSEGDLVPKFTTAAEAGAGPDIIQIASLHAHLYADRLVDVTDMVAALEASYGPIAQIAKDAAMVRGRWRAVPLYATPQVLTYREDVLKEIGEPVPDTWEDALRAGKKLKAKGVPWGEALGHCPVDCITTVYSILWAHGAKEVEKDGKTIALKSPETVKALEFVKRAYDEVWPPGVVGWDNASNNRAFLGGQLGMTINAGTIWYAAKRQAPAIFPHINHAAIPRGPAGRAIPFWPTSLAVFQYSKHQALAKDLVRYVTDGPQIARWLEKTEGAGGSALLGVMRLERSREPKLRLVPEVIQYGRLPGWPGPPTRESAEVHAKFVLVDMAQNVVKGMPIPQAIDQAVAEMRRIYGQR
ncbi:MAG: extracellular solute-binding protein [Candidatus Rokubacteria bacterium]|nr:extracellular solute-binding protein [Candidatus Rokubacteria bacterium]